MPNGNKMKCLVAELLCINRRKCRTSKIFFIGKINILTKQNRDFCSIGQMRYVAVVLYEYKIILRNLGENPKSELLCLEIDKIISVAGFAVKKRLCHYITILTFLQLSPFYVKASLYVKASHFLTLRFYFLSQFKIQIIILD